MWQKIKHHATCRADYPEKPEGELPQQIEESDAGDGYKVWTCVDCGAQVNNLPPYEDPYWDDCR